MNIFLGIITVLLIIFLSPVILLAGTFLLFGIIGLVCLILGIIIDGIVEVFDLWNENGQNKVQSIT